MKGKGGIWRLMWQSFCGYACTPVYWVGFFVLPLFLFLFLGSLMEGGLPDKIPAAIVDLDHSALSRQTAQTLDAMQMVQLADASESYSDARRRVQEGEIYGFFLIPEHFQEDLLAGRAPVISFYTNMTFYVPGSLLYKTFKTTAVYLKAGVAAEVASQVGMNPQQLTGLLLPINVATHPIGNPWLNYSYYLCNSFIPGCLQLMILIMTCFTLGENIKYGRCSRIMQMSGGSIVKAIVGILAPQTLIWVVQVILMTAWLFGWNHYPMYGSWFWLILGQIMFVLAAQGFALVIFGALPNLRLATSVASLLGVLTFSLAAYSFPVESMYTAVGIFSWILPARYNFLIYTDIALNGLDIYYARWWYVAYLVFMAAPFLLMWRIKKAYVKPVYVP